MNRTPKTKRKLIGYGVVLTILLVFLLSFAFTSIGVPDSLSIFLIVLVTGICLFVYYLVFSSVETKKEMKKKDKIDPFNF